MLIMMQKDAPSEDVLRVQAVAKGLGLRTTNISGLTKIAVAIIGDTSSMDTAVFKVLPSVDQVMRVTRQYSLASREDSRPGQMPTPYCPVASLPGCLVA